MKTAPLPLLRISSSLVLLALSGLTAQAQTTWNDPTSNNYWNVPGNWSNGVPTSTTDVIVSGTGGDILLNADTGGLKSLKISGNNSIYTLSSSNSTVRNLTTTAGAAGGFGVAQDTTNMQLTIEGVWARFNAGSNFAYNGSGNSLTLTGAGTLIRIAYPAAFSIGSGTDTVAKNSDNIMTVQGGAAFETAGLVVGSKGGGNSVVVTGAGSRLKVSTPGAADGYNLTIGGVNSPATNSVKILKGATAEIASRDTKIIAGSLTVGTGSSLSHTHTTTVQKVMIGNRGTLYGAGSITATSLEYGDFYSGAVGKGTVYVGETTTDYGTLDFTGEWKNTKITLSLQVGDLTAGAVAGVNYDLLNVNGAFALGGDISIDTGAVMFGTLEEIKLIQWTSVTGNESDLNVSFINGSAYVYVIRQDGFYLQAAAIPEPGSIAFLVLGACGLGFGFVRKRKL